MTTDSRKVELTALQYVTIDTPTGRYRITATGEGIAVHAADGGRLVTAPSGVHNGVDLIAWPSFQPLVPPTSEHPVQVSHDLVREVMDPHANGVSSECVAAVQEAVDAEPAFRMMIDGIIHQTLTKRMGSVYKYETVYVRGQEPGA